MPRTFRIFAVGLLVCWLAVATTDAKVVYDPGYFVDTWEVTGPPNTTFEVKLHHYRCTYRTVASGTTDSSGEASGYIIHWGPGNGYQPYHTGVRVYFGDGTWQGGKLKSRGLFCCANFSGGHAGFDIGQAALSGPLALEFAQNVQDVMDETGYAAWWQDGSSITIRLPEHFIFASVPTVEPILPGDLQVGLPQLLEAGRTLEVPILTNARTEPLNGLAISDLYIAYDGIPLADFYWPAVVSEMALAPAGSPFDPVDEVTVHGAYRGMLVSDWPLVDWFDERLEGVGFESFFDVQMAHAGWFGTPDFVCDFEGFAHGTKISEQYDPWDIWFSGTDGGPWNDLTGVQAEGDPLLVQDLTGYDGTYQPDGSQVYIRFDNTAGNPDAPVRVEFGTLQASVGAFVGCGVEGPEHGFTISVYGEDDAWLGSQTYTPELWEQDPTGQNCETLFAVRTPLPLIQAVTIENDSDVEFANALVLDNVAIEASPSTPFGDRDRDGDVDVEDFYAYEEHHTGPIAAGEYLMLDEAVRYAFDGDGDTDLDLDDFAYVARNFTGEYAFLLPPYGLDAEAGAPGEFELQWQTPLFNAPQDVRAAELAYDIRVSPTYITAGNWTSAAPVSGIIPPVGVNGSFTIRLDVDAQDKVEYGMMQHDKVYLRAWLAAWVEMANVIPWGYPIPNETIQFQVYDENDNLVTSGSGVTDSTGMAQYTTGDINDSHDCSQPNWPMYTFKAVWQGHSITLRNGVVVTSGNQSDEEDMMTCDGSSALPPLGQWSNFGGLYDYGVAGVTVEVALPAGALQTPEMAVQVYEPVVVPPPIGFPPAVPGPLTVFTVEKADGPWLEKPAVLTVTYPDSLLMEYGGVGESSLRAYRFFEDLQRWERVDLPPVALDRDQHAIRFATQMLGTLALAAEIDGDHDGLGDEEELARGLLPGNPDTDGDGILDGDEVWFTGGDPASFAKTWAADQVMTVTGAPPEPGMFVAARMVYGEAQSPVSECVYVAWPREGGK
jgi:hypothetical protein